MTFSLERKFIARAEHSPVNNDVLNIVCLYVGHGRLAKLPRSSSLPQAYDCTFTSLFTHFFVAEARCFQIKLVAYYLIWELYLYLSTNYMNPCLGLSFALVSYLRHKPSSQRKNVLIQLPFIF